MTPEDLRADIPALDRGVYLNTGASGPAPRRVVEATNAFVHHHEEVAPVAEGAYPAAFDALDETRETVAGFVGADPSEIALTESTADGIARVAAAVDWRPGDVVVRTDMEHSAGVLPWWNVRERRRTSAGESGTEGTGGAAPDVEVRVLETERGRIDRDALVGAVDGARLVCLNSLAWGWGTELPVREVVEVAHDAGAHVLVDAVQSFGQTPVDVREWGADFVVGAGHKWLLGPWGAGFLYVDRDVADDLRPAQVGYRSVVDPGVPDPDLRPGAPRFEVGTTSPAPYVGLQTAIETVEAVGLDVVQERVERLTDRLKEGLGDRLLGPRECESGLVPFAADDPEATVARLREEDIVVRELPYPEAVRASVHVFNTAGDVDALLDALEA